MGEVEVKQESKWRHGDVYGIASTEDVAKIRANGTKLDNGILAYGEVTGHMHEIDADPSCFARYQMPDGKKYLIVLAEGGVAIKHQEHGSAVIPQGIWEERIDREYDYLTHQFRNVYD